MYKELSKVKVFGEISIFFGSNLFKQKVCFFSLYVNHFQSINETVNAPQLFSLKKKISFMYVSVATTPDSKLQIKKVRFKFFL